MSLFGEDRRGAFTECHPSLLILVSISYDMIPVWEPCLKYSIRWNSLHCYRPYLINWDL
jgi:hypothetical protein